MRTIKLYNPELKLYSAVAECIKSKDLILTRMGGHPQITNQIVIKDKNLEIRGVTTIIQYLDEKFPHPPLFPPEPEKKALIRMATDELCTEDPDAILNIYETCIPKQEFFSGEKPSVLDFFILGLSPHTHKWSDYRGRFK